MPVPPSHSPASASRCSSSDTIPYRLASRSATSSSCEQRVPILYMMERKHESRQLRDRVASGLAQASQAAGKPCTICPAAPQSTYSTTVDALCRGSITVYSANLESTVWLIRLGCRSRICALPSHSFLPLFWCDLGKKIKCCLYH